MRELINNTDRTTEPIVAGYILKTAFVLKMMSLTIRYFNLSEIGFIDYLFSLFFWVALFRFALKSLQELLFTFWGLSLVLIGLSFRNIVGDLQSSYIGVSANIVVLTEIVLFILFLLPIWIMRDPRYYPRFYWWHFDYLFSADYPIKIKSRKNLDAESYKARLTDMTVDAFSFRVFDQMELGENYFLEFEDWTEPKQRELIKREPEQRDQEGENTQKDLSVRHYSIPFTVISRGEDRPGRGALIGAEFDDREKFESEIKNLFEQRKKKIHFRRYQKLRSLRKTSKTSS